MKVAGALGKRPLQAERGAKLLICEARMAYVPSTVYQAVASDCADVSCTRLRMSFSTSCNSGRQFGSEELCVVNAWVIVVSKQRSLSHVRTSS